VIRQRRSPVTFARFQDGTVVDLTTWDPATAHHPEHAIGALTGPSDDGLGLFYSALDSALAA
jgi:hypothetical protein